MLHADSYWFFCSFNWFIRLHLGSKFLSILFSACFLAATLFLSSFRVSSSISSFFLWICGCSFGSPFTVVWFFVVASWITSRAENLFLFFRLVLVYEEPFSIYQSMLYISDALVYWLNSTWVRVLLLILYNINFFVWSKERGKCFESKCNQKKMKTLYSKAIKWWECKG